ncbi:MAG: NAD-dependent epimerase/dehydratase family protein [Actinobacteria bacterium]|nr:NAD-dependent epimerase/dehydratase family protein [Actinomycetota bacterium]
MKVVVTGATGNVGRALVERLGADPHITEVVGLARRPPDVSLPKTRWASVDVAGDDLAPHFRGADAVVHLAWLFQPSHDAMATWEANAIGSERVFRSVGDADVSALVYASSVGAYSPAPNQWVDENWPTHSMPTAAYGREKAYVERLLDTFEAGHPETRVVRMRPAFTFTRSSATEQRRLFLGPFMPRRLARPGTAPVLPVPKGTVFQSVHTDDVADAYLAAVVGTARGAFNLAAEPVIDKVSLGEALSTKVVELPAGAFTAAMAAAWRLHLVPAPAELLELFLRLPLMRTDRARAELGWSPRHSGPDALRIAAAGIAEGAGGDTPPLEPDSLGGRVEEISTGVGEKA